MPDAVLYARNSPCDMGAELACADVESEAGETIAFSTPDAGTYYVFVDSYSGTTGGVQQLTVTTEPYIRGPGDVCSGATPILASGTLTGQTTMGFHNDYTTDKVQCGTYNNNPGFDRVYSISVPAMKTLTVTVTPDGNEDPSLYLIPAPGSNCVGQPICEVGTDTGGSGAPDMVTFANTGTTARDFFIVVDSYKLDPVNFSLTTAIP